MKRTCLIAAFLAGLVGTHGSLAQVTINVDSLGVKGDGVTWDHKAIQAALNMAGNGSTIELTHGKTYILCNEITFLAGQTLVGNGATLKRCDSLLSSLTSPAASGATVIEIDHPERFEVGQGISVFSGPTHDEGQFLGTLRIAAINGSMITMNKGLTDSYPVGSGVIAVDYLIRAHSNDVSIEGVRIDGNRRNNDEWIAWERGSAVTTRSDLVRITNNLFKDCWSNCLTVSETTVVTDNVFDSVAAAVIHLSGVDSLLFERNHMVDTNTNFAAAEHSGAALTWSAQNQNITVRDNCLNDSQAFAFGNVRRRWNKSVTIEDNLVCRTEGFFGLRSNTPPEPGFETARFTIRNNVGVDVKLSSITTLSDGPAVGNIFFEGNTIVNGYVDFFNLDSSSVSNNTFIMLDHANFGDTTGIYKDEAGVLTLFRPKHTSVEGNIIVGGEKGMYFVNSNGLAAESLIVRNNSILDSERSGIITARVDRLTGPTDSKNDNTGILLESNTVISTLLSEPDDAGIRTTRGATVIDNCVETNRNAAEVSGTASTEATGTPTTLYANNTLVGDSAAVSFISSAYISDILFDTNTVSSSIPAEYALATGTVLQGNVLDESASCTAPPVPPTPVCTVCETGMPELNGVFLDLLVLIEGAYTGSGQMAASPAFLTSLQDSALAHPYAAEMFVGKPQEHHGPEFVLPSLPPGTIDWVIVALRSGEASASEVSRIAALLMDDGSITSLDGTLEIFFPGVSKSSFYVTVYHRNHLAVMSSSPVNFADGHGSWDFRLSSGQAYSAGGEGMKDFGSGFFGMFGADANGDGMVTALDFNMFLVATKAVLTGYRIEDFDFDDQVTVSDFNMFLANTKAVAESQVP